MVRAQESKKRKQKRNKKEKEERNDEGCNPHAKHLTARRRRNRNNADAERQKNKVHCGGCRGPKTNKKNNGKKEVGLNARTVQSDRNRTGADHT